MKDRIISPHNLENNSKVKELLKRGEYTAFSYFTTDCRSLVGFLFPLPLQNTQDGCMRISITYIKTFNQQNPHSRQDSFGNPYIKIPGFDGSNPYVLDDPNIPHNTKHMIMRFVSSDPVTEETAVRIPINMIKKIFDPFARIGEITDAKIQKSALWLASKGIPFNNIGIYGSLQPGITNQTQPHDFDALVCGLKYAGTIKKLADKTRIELPCHQELKEAKKRPDKFARHRISRIYPFGDDCDFHIDVKVIPEPDEPTAFPYDISDRIGINTENEVFLSGRVVKPPEGFLDESLSNPSIYWIEDNYGNLICVIGPRYDHIAVARTGDMVSLSGLYIGSNEANGNGIRWNYVLLQKPNHTINNITLGKEFQNLKKAFDQ